MLLQTDKKKKIFIYFLLFFLLTTFNNLSLIKSNKFDLININVNGLDEGINFKIIKDLNELKFQNIFLLNNEYLKKIIEENNLVHSYKVNKIYPNAINIEIKKTKFLAITHIDNKKFLIGSNGKLIKFESSNKNLPIVFGKINIAKFLHFIKILNQSNFNFEKISEFYFYPSGRWDIKTKDNLLFKLPIENLLNSLNLLNEIIINNGFEGKNIIDLRVFNHLILSNE